MHIVSVCIWPAHVRTWSPGICADECMCARTIVINYACECLVYYLGEIHFFSSKYAHAATKFDPCRTLDVVGPCMFLLAKLDMC